MELQLTVKESIKAPDAALRTSCGSRRLPIDEVDRPPKVKPEKAINEAIERQCGRACVGDLLLRMGDGQKLKDTNSRSLIFPSRPPPPIDFPETHQLPIDPNPSAIPRDLLEAEIQEKQAFGRPMGELPIDSTHWKRCGRRRRRWLRSTP